MGNLHHWHNHIGCSFVVEPELKDSVASGPDASWVGLGGHRGRCCFTRLNEGGAPGVCSKRQCDDEHVNSIYLWEEVEAAQAADDAVDLGEPPAFAAGLQTAWNIRTRTLMCHKTAHLTTIMGLEQWSRAKPFRPTLWNYSPRKNWTCSELPKSRNGK